MTESAERLSEPDALLGASRLAFYTPIRHYPTLADCKAGAILAADGLMISVLILFNERLGHMVKVSAGSNLFETYLILTLLGSFAGLVLIGGYCSYRALTLPIPPMPHSLAYFHDISRLPLDEYRRRITSHSFREVVRAILDYNYSLARLSARKFDLVGRSTACVRAEFFLWIILMLAVALFPGMTS
jgi:hypothetical protein